RPRGKIHYVDPGAALVHCLARPKRSSAGQIVRLSLEERSESEQLSLSLHWAEHDLTQYEVLMGLVPRHSVREHFINVIRPNGPLGCTVHAGTEYFEVTRKEPTKRRRVTDRPREEPLLDCRSRLRPASDRY